MFDPLGEKMSIGVAEKAEVEAEKPSPGPNSWHNPSPASNVQTRRLQGLKIAKNEEGKITAFFDYDIQKDGVFNKIKLLKIDPDNNGDY